MKEYKREKQLLEDDLKKVLKREETFDDRMAVINNALQQVGRFQFILEFADCCLSL